jgi:hypothetical protein
MFASSRSSNEQEMSAPGREKVIKAAGAHPSELELAIASEMFNLEV